MLLGFGIHLTGFAGLEKGDAAAYASSRLGGLLVGRLLQVGLSGSLGVLVFMALGQAFAVQEVREISQTLTRRFTRR